MRAKVLALALLAQPATASAEWQVQPFLGVTFGGGTSFVDLEHAAGHRHIAVGVSGLLLGDVIGIEADLGHMPGFFQTGDQALLKASRVSTLTGNVVLAMPRHLTQYTLRPYFVVGAIFSGLAMLLTLMAPGRFLLEIKDYVTIDHLENVAKLLVAMSMLLTYSYGSEMFFAWYRGDPFERAQWMYRAGGSYAGLFWLTLVCNSVAPLAFLSRRVRRNTTALFALSIVINVGMWTERFVIIVASLAHEYDAYSWGAYRPTAFEWTILVGSAAWFLFWFLPLIGHIPAVPMAETKERLLDTAPLEGVPA